MLSELQALLDGAEPASVVFTQRMAAARDAMLSNGARSDLIVLVRQALEHWALTVQRGSRIDAVVYVPRDHKWPDEEQWERAGIDAHATADGRFALRSKPWRPGWLSELDASVVEDAVAAVERRPNTSVPADPAVRTLLGIERFHSEGQRDAVRSVFLTPSGSTILIVLPTGAGKSLVFQFAALHGSSRGGLTLVVVPTVALARDQERRYREMAERVGQQLPSGVPLAYHGGLTDEEKVAQRRAIADGHLPIVFAAPEAILGSLQRSLIEAAENGQVANFAIDEAHIVAQWGELRPEFQAIAGFRDALQRKCPDGHAFRTLLLTATLTAEGYDLLQTVFGRQSALQVVSDVQLRSEPAYLISRAASSAEKKERLLEAIFVLPRPLIIYVTEPRDAEQLCNELRQRHGFHRLDSVVGGDMSTPRGEAILRKWTSGELDLIVATSAFGLGVDQSDVRSIIHACLPESIDRWYQEVGRAGRDGCASVALLIPDDHDIVVSRDMANETLIGHQKAWDRWQSMWKAATVANANEGLYRIPHDALSGERDVNTRRNEKWNLRTLAMMVRAKLLRYGYALAPRLQPGEPEPPADASRATYVALRDAAHLDHAHFEQRLSTTRSIERNNDRANTQRLTDLLEGTRWVHDILRDTYLIPGVVSIAATRGNCPVSRRQGLVFNAHVGIVTRTIRLETPLSERLSACFQMLPRDYRGPLIVGYRPETGFAANDSWRRLLRRLAEIGVVEFDWPTTGFGTLDWKDLCGRACTRYLVTAQHGDDVLSNAIDLPRASLIEPDSAQLSAVLEVIRTHHVLFVPPGLVDPISPYRLFDHRVHMDLPVFRERTNAR